MRQNALCKQSDSALASVLHHCSSWFSGVILSWHLCKCWNKNSAYSIFSHSIISLGQNLGWWGGPAPCFCSRHILTAETQCRRICTWYAQITVTMPFTPSGSKSHVKRIILMKDYPFTGFLQIWRSVSCVIACVPSIRAALIFFLFAVLIIFISRRFPWLLGGFLKWSTTKL